MTKEERDWAATEVLYRRYRHIDEKARAVIAAGRPHVVTKFHGRQGYKETQCPCPQCAAWDALAELLKTP